MTTPLRSARERAREEVRAAILDKAREHLAEHGPAGLSLRAVARDLGLVSSAVYRYFENRDALLTAMIVDAYDGLGDMVDGALRTFGPDRDPRERWVVAAVAVRGWALHHPQEYALLYGSPVPGYTAPVDTVVPGIRVSLALVGIVAEAVAAGIDVRGEHPASEATRQQLEHLATLLPTPLPVPALFATLLAWTQLFGLLTFELFGQTRGMVDDHEALFTDMAALTADRLGLRDV